RASAPMSAPLPRAGARTTITVAARPSSSGPLARYSACEGTRLYPEGITVTNPRFLAATTSPVEEVPPAPVAEAPGAAVVAGGAGVVAGWLDPPQPAIGTTTARVNTMARLLRTGDTLPSRTPRRPTREACGAMAALSDVEIDQRLAGGARRRLGAAPVHGDLAFAAR